MYGTAQHLIKLAFIKGFTEVTSYMSPLQNLFKDRYTLVEQSGIYSNRTVMYTLIKYACEHPYPYVKELVKLIIHSNIKCKTEHDLIQRIKI